MKPDELCQDIELILSDVDGVFTDGGIIFDNQGIETKRFHIRDGLGVKLWLRAGYEFGIVTSRTSHIVRLRAAELGVKVVRQAAEDKLPAALEILDELGYEPRKVCYVGDDLTDLPLIRHVGFGVAVADASPEVLQAADYVTTLSGGCGAVREIIEVMLKAKNRWDDLICKYLTL